MDTRKLFLVFTIQFLWVLYCRAGTGSITIGADMGGGGSVLYGSFDRVYSGSLYNSPNIFRVQPIGAWGINGWYNFPRLFSLGTGIYYCRTTLESPGWISYQNEYTLYALEQSNINIPILLRVSFGKEIVFFAEGGWCISINTDGAGGGGIYDAIAWTGRSGVFGAVTAGTGIHVPLPHRFALSFEARANVELLNFNSGYGLKSYNCMFLGGFTYTIPISAKKS